MGQVSEADIARVISKWTGIPVAKVIASEQEKLLLLTDELHKRIIGQDEAVEVRPAARVGREYWFSGRGHAILKGWCLRVFVACACLCCGCACGCCHSDMSLSSSVLGSGFVPLGGG